MCDHTAATAFRHWFASARKIHSFEPEEMAFKAERMVDGGMHAQERSADRAVLRRCILRSRRRTGACEFSARLFFRSPFS